MASKADIRRQAKLHRAELARGMRDFAQRIVAFTREIPAAEIVAGYWPVRDEADPRELMKALVARGGALALPRIDAKDSALSFRAWREGDALIDNHHGIAEPRADAAVVVPDVILVPLLAFDALGHRLGYGGGYYDRTLSLHAAVTIGVAYSGQQTDRLPREAHDHPLDAVLTENGLRRFTTRPG